MTRIVNALAFVVVLLLFSSQSNAGTIASTIIKTTGGLGGDFDVSFDGTNFATFSNLNVPAKLRYTGFLSTILGDQFQTGSILIRDVAIDGLPTQPHINIPVYTQNTSGGEFEIHDPSWRLVPNNLAPSSVRLSPSSLLLSGELSTGVLHGGPSSGGFISTGDVTFTGGSLAHLFDPIGALSLSLTDIVSTSQGFQLQQSSGRLSPFVATMTAQIDASITTRNGAVPEPTSLLVFAPIFMSIFPRRRPTKNLG